MRTLAVSPLRYWFCHLNPDRKQDEEESKALRMGTALHCAVLEPERFASEYVAELDRTQWEQCLDTIGDMREWITAQGEKPKGSRKSDIISQAISIMERTGERVPILSEELERFAESNVGKTVLRLEEWARVTGMATALRQEPSLLRILEDGNAETTFTAKDPDTGVLLKARFDWFSDRYTLDLKTFAQKRGASITESVCNAIYYEGYYRQAYFYDYVRRLVTGEKPGSFETVFAFVESDQPHETRMFSFQRRSNLGENNIYWQQAYLQVSKSIRLYADCLSRYGDQPWREEQGIETLEDENIRQLAY